MFEGIRAFFNARKISRWSLYFVHERDDLRYALHDDAVDILLGFIAAPIKRGKRISPDWELHLNFNFEDKSIKLIDAFFSKNGVSQILFELIATIDSEWMVPMGELIFVDTRTHKRLPLGPSDLTYSDRASRATSTRARSEHRGDDDKGPPVTLVSVLSKAIH
jgi:hypothetical protein